MIPNRLKETAAQVRERHRRHIRVVCILVVVAQLVAMPVGAATMVVFDDFEDGDLSEWSIVDPDTTDVTQTNPLAGDYSMHINSDASSSLQVRNRLSFTGDTYESMTYWLYIDNYGNDFIYVNRLFGSGGTDFGRVTIESDGSVFSDNGATDTGVDLPSQTWLKFTTKLNWSENEYTLTVETKDGNEVLSITDTMNGASNLSGFDIIYDREDNWSIYLDEFGANGYDPTVARYAVSGTVTDQDDEPISNVSVEISDSTTGDVLVTTTTDGDGGYSTELQNGSYVANFSKVGYSDAQETFTVAGERVRVDAQLVEQRLRLEGRKLFQPGSTHDYRVIFETADESGNLDGVDVTDSATVTSSNTSILTVDEAQATMTAVDDENVSKVVTVNMSYQSYSGQAKIVVAEATVDNLAILPTGLTRAQAVMLDDFIFALLIAAFLSVPASRFANAFAGLGVAEMVIVVGWLGGFVPLGIAMLSIFMAMFVGLNLAANIDYTMRR